MKTNIIKLSAIATVALAGSLIAADQSPAPSSPPSSSPTDVRNPTNPSAVQGEASGANAAAAAKFNGKITMIDKESKMVTIVDKDGVSKKVHIGDTTKLVNSTGSATWDDLKVGTEVQGTHRMQGAQSHAESVTISTSTEVK